MTDILVLDKEFNTLSVIDTFHSLIWITRRKDVGEFELHLPVETRGVSDLERGNYLIIEKSDRVMIVENKQSNLDDEEGNKLVISGRSLESILDRRIVWKKTLVNGNLQNGIKKLITENAISPSDPSRKIPGLIFQDSNDPRITSIEIEPYEFLGEDLLSIVEYFCDLYDLGFSILLDNTDGTMIFSLYMGEDLSYKQDKNPYITFSPEYDNLYNSSYYESDTEYKNVILASAYIDGENPTFIEVKARDSVYGLDRREMYGEVSGIVTVIDDKKISDADFKKQVAQKGAEELSEHPVKIAFEGEIEALQQFVLGRDFFLGDVVQVVNDYGIESRSRIDEIILNEDSSGYQIYPTFVGIENDSAD